jgi:hypothetical protein
MSVAKVEKILGVSAAADGSIWTGVGTNLEFEVVFTSKGRIYEMWRRQTFLDLPEALRPLQSKRLLQSYFRRYHAPPVPRWAYQFEREWTTRDGVIIKILPMCKPVNKIVGVSVHVLDYRRRSADDGPKRLEAFRFRATGCF